MCRVCVRCGAPVRLPLSVCAHGFVDGDDGIALRRVVQVVRTYGTGLVRGVCVCARV